MTQVILSRAWLETCGDASLEGLLFEHGILEPRHVTLAFERFYSKGDGPELILAPDFMPACLVKSVASLCAKGFRFTVETRMIRGPA